MEDYRAAVSEAVARAFAPPAPFDFPESLAVPIEDFLAPAIALSRGGKRTRALFALAGWQAGASLSKPALAITLTSDLPIALGAALELYQISALIHDDVIDSAATRRGVPTAHIAFSRFHQDNALLGDSTAYGQKMALLLGDYVLSLAALTLEEGLDAALETTAKGGPRVVASPGAAAATRRLFHSMCAEVAFGQFADVHAEFTPLGVADSTAYKSAFSVLYHKAARYSVTVPTLLGAISAGAHSSVTAELEKICTPLGEAFQLRDDALGIFGEPGVTGKPAGDDISEGKRTVLLALAREKACAADRAILDSLVGNPLDAKSLAEVRAIMKRSGTYAHHEELIKEREGTARDLIAASSLRLDILHHLALQLSGRVR